MLQCLWGMAILPLLWPVGLFAIVLVVQQDNPDSKSLPGFMNRIRDMH